MTNQFFFGLVKKRILLLTLIPLFAATCSGLLAFFVLQPVYQASAIIMVGKPQGTSENIQYDTILANKHLVKTYAEIARSRTVLETAKTKARLSLDLIHLRKKITVELVRDTELIQIMVEDNNPRVAYKLANAMTEAFSDRVVEIMKLDNVSVVDRAEIPTVPAKPRKVLNIVVAYVAGLLAAFTLAIILEHRAKNLGTI